MTDTFRFSLALKMLRESRGVYACELSVRAGLADYTVSRIETGKLNLDFATAVRLAAQLGVSLDAIAQTANTLPSELVEQEACLLEARKNLKELRQKSKSLRRSV